MPDGTFWDQLWSEGQLSDRLAEELARENPVGTVTPDQVQAWFRWVWPRFRRRGYKTERALWAWWARVTPAELEKAVRVSESTLAAQETARLEAVDAAFEPVPTPSEKTRSRVSRSLRFRGPVQ